MPAPPTNGRQRILAISEYYWPSEGGAAVMMRRLADGWREQGHEVTVLTTRSEPNLPLEEAIDGVPVFRLIPWRVRLLYTVHFVSRAISWIRGHRGEFDVACVSMLKHAAFASIKACRSLGIPVVLRTEGGGETGDVAWQETAVLGSWIRKTCQNAEAVVAISNPIYDELLGADYPVDRVRRIPNGVFVPDRPWVPEEVGRARADLGLPDLPTICYTGRLRALKGLADLIHALPIVESRIGPCQLLFVGDGLDRDNLEREVARLGLDERVHFVGHVPDVFPYLRASDLYVLPSYVEGMSIALLEAMALGLPATASDIDANRGLVPEEMLPLFPIHNPPAMAERIVSQIRVPAGRPGLLERTRALVSDNFAMPNVARRYVELFEELQSHKSARARIKSRSRGVELPRVAGDVETGGLRLLERHEWKHWDSWLAGVDSAHIRQAAGYSSALELYGNKSEILVYEESGAIRAGALLGLRQPAFFFGLSVQTSGGIALDESRDVDALRRFLVGLLERAAELRASRVNMALNVPLSIDGVEDATAQRIVSLLRGVGFEFQEHFDTYHVDLGAESPEALLETFGKNPRRHIRRAQRDGLIVEPSLDERDFTAFDAAHHAMSRRKHLVPVAQGLFSQKLLPLCRDGLGDLYVARFDGQARNYIFTSAIGQPMYLWGALTPAAREPGCPPTGQALHFAAMCAAMERGCSSYDFGGTPGRIPDPAHPNYSVWKFKHEFQGRYVRTLGWWRFTLRPGSSRLLDVSRRAITIKRRVLGG